MDLTHRCATELRTLLKERAVSPTELAEACLRRVETINGAVNAIVTLNERLLDDARALEEVGDPTAPLYGLPVGIKDTTQTAGIRTTFGSPLHRNLVPSADAVVVARLRAAGALILGKTNTPPFAIGGNTVNEVFGATRNPWNLSRTCGGSTGGGAAALAAGMVTLADGSDLGGSLRMPASFCGVVGLRPSPGLVPLAPTPHLWDRLSVAGGMGRTAGDVALFLEATCGPSPESPVCQPSVARTFLETMRPGTRLAYCSDIVDIGIQPDIEQACRQAAFELRQVGCQVDEVGLDLSDGRTAFATLRAYSLLATHHGHRYRHDELGTNLGSNLKSALKTSAQEFAAAEAYRSTLWRRLKVFFNNYQALLTPCMAISPFPVEQDHPVEVAGRQMTSYHDWFAPTSVLSVTGLPVASVPCGLDTLGLPVGMQIVGPPLGEGRVLGIANTIQQASPIGLPPL